MKTPYELLGGENGVRQLAQVFYDVMDELPDAAPIRAMHAASLNDVKERLFEYLSGWLGGPRIYEEKFNTVCLTKPHRPFTIGEAERDQWLMCMDEALRRVGAPEECKQMLKVPFQRIADAIRNDDCATKNNGECND